MKYLWLVFVVAMAGGFYFTPPPEPNETTLHYILEGRETWQSLTCAVIASGCATIIFMHHMMTKDQRDRER